MIDTLPKPLYQKYHPSTRVAKEEAIEELFQQVLQASNKLALDKFELRLVLDEAITNAMEHGNHWDPEKKVTINLYPPEKDYVLVAIKDQGFGFAHQNLPYDTQNSIKSDKVNYRGRGIFIIRQFCEIFWNQVGNEIFMKIPLR